MVPTHAASGEAPAPDLEQHDVVLRAVPIAQCEGMTLNGTIRDGCTLADWGHYKLWTERDALAKRACHPLYTVRETQNRPFGRIPAKGQECTGHGRLISLSKLPMLFP